MKNPLRKVTQLFRKHQPLAYQQVHFKGTLYSGSVKTRRMFYSLDILNEIRGRSFVDLGCNRGGYVFLAEDNGASPTIGVDVNEHSINQARKIADKHGSSSEFVVADIFDYSGDMGSTDFLLCTAVFRHLYAQVKQKYDPNFTQPKQYLTYTSMDVLIRQNSDDNDEIKSAYDAILRTMIDKANLRFICSFNDNSGLIHRRAEEVDRYFKSLHPRVKSTETFIPDYGMHKYIFVNLQMEPIEKA